MKYKKLLAATAMTSAAFVVPVMVGAEEIAPEKKDELIASGTYLVGDTVKAALTEIVMPAGAVDKIVSYEWFIDDATTASSKTEQMQIPLNMNAQSIKLIVTTESGKKYTDSITTTPPVEFGATVNGEPKANGTIDIYENTLEIPNDIVKGYQWYVVDGNSYKMLTGETELELDILPEYHGKKVMMLVSTEKGNYYYSLVDVQTLETDFDSVEFAFSVNGKPLVSQKIIVGDTIQLQNFELSGKNDEVLKNSDYEVTYRWLAIKQNGTKVSLANATSNSVVVPIDSDKNKYAMLELEISIYVPSTKETYTKPVTVSLTSGVIDNYDQAILILYNDYTKILNGDSVTAIKQKLEELTNQYNALTETAKTAVTNSSKLNEMNQVYKVIVSLVTEFEAVEAEREQFEILNSETKQANLLKRIEKLKKSVNTLTKAQQTIFYAEISTNGNTYEKGYLETLYEWVNKSSESDASGQYLTVQGIKTLNGEIEAIINTSEKKYEISDGVDNLARINAFEETVKALLVNVNSIDKAYHPLIKIQLLKTAQADVKKAKSVVTSMNKVATITTDAKKKASALIAAQKSYNKLNMYQASLIADITILNPENEDDPDGDSNLVSDKVIDINALIDKLITVGATEYTDGIVAIEEKVEEITLLYKMLSSSEKKQVPNYKLVSQAKKDASAVKKVAASIYKAFDAYDTAKEYAGDDELLSKYISKMNSAQGKFASAYKAYAKLTPQQLSILLQDDYVPESETTYTIADFLTEYAALTSTIGDESFDEKKEYDQSKSEEVVSIIEEMALILEKAQAGKDTSSADLDIELELKINAAKAVYKTLNAYEKKLVNNYGLISTASSHLSKAKTAKKKLETATDDKKFLSAKQAYDKLQTVQQGLIVTTYNKKLADFEYQEVALTAIDEALAMLKNINNYTATAILELQEQLKFVSSKDQKLLKNYSLYQTALKDLKAVESLIPKIDKLGENPSYSNKEKMYASYLKLTAKQQAIFDKYERPFDSNLEKPADLLEKWMNSESLEENSKKLNERIGQIIISGNYQVTLTGDTSLAKLVDFNQKLDVFTNEYKALDSKERKLVVNYSYIKAAEKDLKAVRAVYKLKEDLKVAEDSKKASIESKLQQAKNRLTVEQESLYHLVAPVQQP